MDRRDSRRSPVLRLSVFRLMAWPLASHFSAMLQNPAVAFRDAGLRACVIEKNAFGQPRPWAGSFAVVYKATDQRGDNPFAVRVFTTESPERRERYAAVSQYLETRRLRCLCDFEYRDNSIRSASDGKWYPLILMEWVEGQTLYQWARAKCLAGDTRALAEVAERWVSVVRELAEASVAHGDLQHANVMVTPRNELKLVDYDCMCVPALVGRRNLEVGIEPYQHPDRDEQTLLSPDLDNFSALVIHTALRALAADPALWQRYVEAAGYDKLLLRRADILQPSQSALAAELRASSDPDVRRLFKRLCQLARGPIDRVSSLAEAASSYLKIGVLLKAGHWEAAVRLLNQRGHFRDAPEELKPLIRQAYEHVCRARAWDTFRRLPDEASEQCDRQLTEAWNEALFAGFEPAEQRRTRVAEARRRVAIVDRVYHLAQQLADQVCMSGERKLVEAAAPLPQGYRHAMSERVAQARRRLHAVTRLNRALEAGGEAPAVLAAGRALGDLGAAGMLTGQQQRAVALAARRAPLLKELEGLPDDLPLDEYDARLIDIWHRAGWHDASESVAAEARRWIPRHQQAVERVALARRLRQAVEEGNLHAAAALDRQLTEAVGPAPGAYQEVLDQARQQVARIEALDAALRQDDAAGFAEHFEAALIRRLAARFAPYQDRIVQWTSEHILASKRLGLRKVTGLLPGGRGSVAPEDDPPGRFRLRWHWPEPRLVQRCLITISPEAPGLTDDPETMATYESTVVERTGYDRHGGQIHITADRAWMGGHVAIWALADLGFDTLRSPPVVLGRLKPTGRWKWASIGAG